MNALHRMKNNRRASRCFPLLGPAALVLTLLFLLMVRECNCPDPLPTARSSVVTASGSVLSYQLANQQSGGYFDDVADGDWLLLQERHALQFPNHKPDMLVPPMGKDSAFPRNWYLNHFDPEFTCQHERRIGQKGDGGKWICDPHRIAKQKCLIYSIGSNGDVSFEQAIREEVSKDCEIHTFDIDNPDGDFEAKLKQIGAKFHKVGLGSARHVESDPKNFKTLKQIVKMLGHQRRTIEVFKIDCENCEWATYSEWFEIEQLGTTIRQIQVEVHQFSYPAHKDFFFSLHDRGYVIFHKEADMWRKNVEYAFIKVEKEFLRNNFYATHRRALQGKISLFFSNSSSTHEIS